jgi:hypothetical protein
MGIFNKSKPTEPRLQIIRRTTSHEALIGYWKDGPPIELDVTVHEKSILLSRRGGFMQCILLSKEEFRLLAQFVAECEVDDAS